MTGLHMSKYSVIITAGGIGKRMGSTLPKQFILVKDKPILMHTIERFYHFDPAAQMIITLPEEWKAYWEGIIAERDFRIPHRVVSGGEERYHSIKNALKYCIGQYVMVHDGVRPLVSVETLERCYKEVKQSDAVIPVVPVFESLRKKSDSGTSAVDRNEYVLVQTPQCFKKEVIQRAYDLEFSEDITDDATLVEKCEYDITTVAGNEENIKITNQSDLAFAEHLLK